MDTEQISREQLGYLAGVLDSEGCIEAHWRWYKEGQDGHTKKRCTLVCQVTISNSDVRLLKEISTILKKIPGLGFYYTTTKKKDGSTWCINLNTTGKGSAKKLLEVTTPYLQAKKDQAETMLELIEYREKLGFMPSRGRETTLQDDPCIQLYVERLHRLKKDPPSLPSETKRRANQILGSD